MSNEPRVDLHLPNQVRILRLPEIFPKQSYGFWLQKLVKETKGEPWRDEDKDDDNDYGGLLEANRARQRDALVEGLLRGDEVVEILPILPGDLL